MKTETIPRQARQQTSRGGHSRGSQRLPRRIRLRDARARTLVQIDPRSTEVVSVLAPAPSGGGALGPDEYRRAVTVGVLTRLLERSGLTVKLLKAPDDRPTDFVVTLSGEAARKDSSRASRVHLVVGEALWADGTGELPLGDDVHTSRYYALTAHYRSPWLLSLNGLFAAKLALQTLQSQTRGLAIAGQPLSQPLSELSPGARAQRQSFYAALGEDLNTPKALCILWKVAHSDLPPNERRALLLDFDQALELRLDAAKTDADLPAEADALIEQRAEARRKKDWPRSDSLREELSSLGLEAHDTPEGSTYRRRDQPV